MGKEHFPGPMHELKEDLEPKLRLAKGTDPNYVPKNMYGPEHEMLGMHT